jgi:hypothetical protein
MQVNCQLVQRLKKGIHKSDIAIAYPEKERSRYKINPNKEIKEIFVPSKVDHHLMELATLCCQSQVLLSAGSVSPEHKYC